MSGIRTHYPRVRADEEISCLDSAATVTGKDAVDTVKKKLVIEIQ